MTLDERIDIQNGLANGMTFKDIAKRIGKDQTTVSKEVKLHAKEVSNGFTKIDQCCSGLMKAPFVCNGCRRRGTSSCQYKRRMYNAKIAQKEYEITLRESREGIPLSKEEFYRTEAIISGAVKAGQHIYHAIQANALPVSKTTVYRHIGKGYYSIKKIDLPRAVKFKTRKSSASDYAPKTVRVGRSYNDFLNYMTDNQGISHVEMDTVIGRPGGKVIMTFQFVSVDFMFALLLENKTAAEAADKILSLKKKLFDLEMSFGKIFPVILTDNGGEFSRVSAFENDLNGCRESSLFFCDPNSPYQKPHVENNHELFRNIVPKGSSFDDFNQDTVNLIFSHVNAVKRLQFNGKSAYDMFTFAYSAELADALGISFVQPKNVVQSPALLR